MQPEVRILNNAFAIFGLYPLDENESKVKKFYSYFSSGAFLVLSFGIGLETIHVHYNSNSAILPMTYFMCSIFGLLKRWSILHFKSDFKKLLNNFDNYYHYQDENNFRITRYSEAALQKLHKYVTLLLMNLFFFAYASPFLNIILGKPLDYTCVIYPFFLPWKIGNFFDYMLIYFVQAILLAPALIQIHTYTILIVFVTVNFGNEFKKICEAINMLETRVLQNIIEYGGTLKGEGNRKYFAGHGFSQDYEKYFFLNLREGIEHCRVIHENFRIFGHWYNTFFSIELIESISTICLLFYCAIKKSDLSLILSLLSLSSHLVSSLFFRCYIGEYFAEKNEIMMKELYDTHWYEQPKSTMKMIQIFHGQIKQPFSFNGLTVKQFPASFRTFTRVARVSYSYLNVLLNS